MACDPHGRHQLARPLDKLPFIGRGGQCFLDELAAGRGIVLAGAGRYRFERRTAASR